MQVCFEFQTLAVCVNSQIHLLHMCARMPPGDIIRNVIVKCALSGRHVRQDRLAVPHRPHRQLRSLAS